MGEKKFLSLQLKKIFKCSHARGNPTAVSPSTRSINSQNQNWVPNKIALSVKSGRKHSKWSLKKYMSGAYLAKSRVHISPLPLQHRQPLTSRGSAALGLRQWKRLGRKGGSFSLGRKSWGAALGFLAEREQSKAWAPLCYRGTASVHPGRLCPQEKMNPWLWNKNPYRNKGGTRGQNQSAFATLILVFALCIYLTLHALFFFFVIYGVCDYLLLKG